MIKPHIHIPYGRIYEFIDIIKNERLDLEIYFDAKSLDSITDEDILKLKKALSYKPSLSFHAPFMDLSPGAIDSKVKNITIERFGQMFDIAEKLLPKAIVFHSGYDKWKYAFKVNVWLEESIFTWSKLLPRAESLNVKIAIENIFEEEPESLQSLMKAINSPYFGVCFDTGHFNLFSKKSLEEWMSYLNNYIVEFHLHDNHKKFDEHLAIGEGFFDFDKLFKINKCRNCIYTIETHSVENVFKSIKRFNEYLNKSEILEETL
uniref:Sugar phosphate isomerase/epimerase n=1 Tax=Thermodesulfovibrio aggregans TaxID=86166 RepID=A0A7C4AJU8_9BACT